jgi:hypothetical protein
MLTKRLFTISLLLPLVAISATAHAGSTISDKSYWPSEARQSAQNKNGWLAKRFEFRVRVRPGSATFTALDESE